VCRVSSDLNTRIQLRYGKNTCFTHELESARIAVHHVGPQSRSKPCEVATAALRAPISFPPLKQLVIPDDKVILALDHGTPAAADVVAAVWLELESSDVNPRNVTILQSPAPGAINPPDPRSRLDQCFRAAIEWKMHDPENEKSCGYLASTAQGGRVYLAREVLEADIVIPIGRIGFDPLLGYRGTSSVFYPGLSNAKAVTGSRGQGHSELTPGEARPLRQKVDEIAWLLGTQFAVQTIPGRRCGAGFVLAGAPDAVFDEGCRLLDGNWVVELDQRPDTVIAAMDSDPSRDGWDDLGAAVNTARNLVARGGRIIVLSAFTADPGPGMKMLRRMDSPEDAIKPLRLEAPPDLVPATQLASAADWARIYLLSGLEADLVEDLFTTPLENHREVERLIANSEPCAFLESAPNVFARIVDGG